MHKISKASTRHALLLTVAASVLLTVGCETRFHVYATAAPPPLQVEAYGSAPGPDYIWVNGYWGWQSNRYTWVPGRWQRPPRGRHHWEQGRWEQRGNRYYYRKGHWRQ